MEVEKFDGYIILLEDEGLFQGKYRRQVFDTILDMANEVDAAGLDAGKCSLFGLVGLWWDGSRPSF